MITERMTTRTPCKVPDRNYELKLEESMMPYCNVLKISVGVRKNQILASSGFYFIINKIIIVINNIKCSLDVHH